MIFINGESVKKLGVFHIAITLREEPYFVLFLF